jgi:ubiquinone/menaquinone biosynthesis C-methylase UbiE
MHSTQEVLAVSPERWASAQKWERSVWVDNNAKNSALRVAKKYAKALLKDRGLFWKYLKHGDFYCGDDHNYWWQKEFGDYDLLPREISRAIEVGCGPYSNIRLISSRRSIGEIVCADPLIRTYEGFSHTWISDAIRTGRVTPSECGGEAVNFNDASFDLSVCINVLDHVQDANVCLKELVRVTRPGGYIVLGQDLTNDDDLLDPENRDDVGHPIKMTHDTLDASLLPNSTPVLRKVLTREAGRNPSSHYGTYIFIGRRS